MARGAETEEADRKRRLPEEGRRGDCNLLAIPLGHRVVNGPLAPVATAAVVWLFGLNYAHFCIAFARLSYS